MSRFNLSGRILFPYFLYLLCFLCLSPSTPAQQPPVDPAEISRDLLYHPARRIETSGLRMIFRATQFTYRFDPASGQWEVTREKNFDLAEANRTVQVYKSARRGTEYRFVSKSTDDEGILEIHPREDVEPLVRLVLWNRKQLAEAWLSLLRQDSPGLTAEALAKDLEVADPEVADVADDGASLWLAIRHYAGEGSLGLGTIVRFDPQANQAKVFHPPALATSSVTHIVAAGGALWLGTYRQGEGAISATKGLVHFDPASQEVRGYPPESTALMGRIVTALAISGETLLVATDAAMCRADRPGGASESWTCWRIVPTVRLPEAVPVSNRPGAPPGGQLGPGSYEARWANAGYFEVVTPDWIEGWIAADDVQEATGRRFDMDAYELGNGSSSGITPMRLLAKPGSDPLAGAVVYRAPLERIGAATAEGFQRVRARIGWIKRGNLEVTPVIQPVSSAPAAAH